MSAVTSRAASAFGRTWVVRLVQNISNIERGGGVKSSATRTGTESDGELDASATGIGAVGACEMGAGSGSVGACETGTGTAAARAGAGGGVAGARPGIGGGVAAV